eukprot:1155008-Pelagomonas_calceolata.AAC.4
MLCLQSVWDQAGHLQHCFLLTYGKNMVRLRMHVNRALRVYHPRSALAGAKGSMWYTQMSYPYAAGSYPYPVRLLHPRPVFF